MGSKVKNKLFQRLFPNLYSRIIQMSCLKYTLKKDQSVNTFFPSNSGEVFFLFVVTGRGNLINPCSKYDSKFSNSFIYSEYKVLVSTKYPFCFPHSLPSLPPSLLPSLPSFLPLKSSTTFNLHSETT